MKANTFSSLPLSPELLRNVESLGYATMTPIQAQSLPAILAGKDVIGQAKTGSGKTAAFGLGILSCLDFRDTRVQALVLCPTRELADQVAKALRQLARMSANVKVLTLCGGMPYRPQVSSLGHGAHIVVGTPGRIGKHLRVGGLDLGSLRVLVLDEGDRMLEMGFQEEVDAIIARAPRRRQTLLFSATFPRTIEAIAESVMVDPVRVEVESTHDSGSIEQHFYACGDSYEERLAGLRLLLHAFRPGSVLVFCSTKVETQDVRDDLGKLGFGAVALHGDMEQNEREETLVLFSNKSVPVLVATDVAARGLDIDAVDAVINFRLSKDEEVHVHRVGRTGRAGSKGKALSLVGDWERGLLLGLESQSGTRYELEALPERRVLESRIAEAAMATLTLRIGKRQKVRAGNILGALTGPDGLPGEQVGQIDIFDNWTYVAVARSSVVAALKKLDTETWKGRPIKAWRVKG